MKNNFIFLLCCFFSILISFESFCSEDGTEFYISPKGKDTNPGTQKAPFNSLEKARDAIRLVRKNDKEKPVTIYVYGGSYYMDKPVVFTSEDSGSDNSPIIYKSVAGEEPVFTGSKRLSKWNLLKDKQKLDVLDPSVNGKVFVTDLKAAGISNFGDPTKAGERPELYCNRQLQTLARWPNGKFTKAGLARGKTVLPRTYIGVNGTKEGIFEYTGKRQNRWAKESDIRVSGYWYWDWAEEYQKVDRIDTESGMIFIKEPFHGYGYKDSLRYFGLNLFCEIDQPGEWYLDRNDGMLFWYAPEGIEPAKAEVILTVFSEPYMVEARNCSYMTLQGLTFRESRGSAILISEGTGCLIADCRIERFGRDGIHIEQGAQNTISGCLLSTFGHGGMKISGGDRKKLIPGNHHVENTAT